MANLTSPNLEINQENHLRGLSNDDVTIVKSQYPFGHLEVLKKSTFENFPNLREVLLPHLAMGSIDSDVFGICQNLQVFNVEFNNLSAIDGAIFDNCRSLREIYLGFNRIVDFPMNLAATLEILSLRGNKIQNIPILGNSELIELNLSNNLIDFVEENAFEGLKKLKILDLSENKLTKISGNFPQISELLLTGNSLTEIAIVAPQIKNLDLSDNDLLNFEKLAENFPQMQKLLSINLAQNWLKNVKFPPLESLKTLNLAHNEIKIIEENEKPFENLANLEFLSLAGNFMTNMGSHSLDGLENLQKLDLNTNHLEFLEISSNSLKILNLNDNKFTNLTKFPESLEILTLSRNLLQNLEFEGLKNLKELRLNANLIKNLPTGVFSPLVKLTKLDLSHNYLKVIEFAAFQRIFFFLEEIYLNFNEIDEIESNLLRNLPNLKVFDASFNPCVKMTINSVSQVQNCFENFQPPTTTTEMPATKEPTPIFNRKDLMMSIVGILGIACVLFALIYYIHGIILLRERREAMIRGAPAVIKGSDATLPNYNRF